MPKPPEFQPHNFQQIREATGMAVGQFAKWVGVTRQTITNWESGRSVPTGPALRVFQLLKQKFDA